MAGSTVEFPPQNLSPAEKAGLVDNVVFFSCRHRVHQAWNLPGVHPSTPERSERETDGVSSFLALPVVLRW